MALKRQQDMLATFSMASMTDVIFLLLVFFLVTSSFVFPTAVDVNLPQGSQQTAVKPAARVYIDASSQLFVSSGDSDPQPVSKTNLAPLLSEMAALYPGQAVALYADVAVPYGDVVAVINCAAEQGIKMILATKAAPDAVKPGN